ncbi:sacsin N-terminal ATP-binding-like domain-containing protein [Cylindrospermum sp. FACHB-282]|uniref:sacsin N-terminal ATP-binding-like domain-containing protein n=1 Tax=Cylindrospermum sp. FACHB-282 TaxID=2692794 RepID=UPI0016874A2B|nr:hypothetical protein [Cylindrospermum sp. FACHB-282]MBD2385167.1 hypothetical protein [Cylindrospermum sp. FACHB-282]
MSLFDQDAVRDLNRIAAQKIFEKMRILRMSSGENAKRRWICELLQNVNDKAAIDFPNEQVSVSIKFDNNRIYFSHNYSYFTLTNVKGLIRQISSEDKDWGEIDKTQIPKTIGRFGTGFLTTHLLSEKVEVSGIFKNEDNSFKKINFYLDRSGRQLPVIIESINHSFQQAVEKLELSTKIENPDFTDFNTTFEYELNDQGISTAETGLNDLENSLPYTLIFVDRINYLKLARNEDEIIYEKKQIKDLTNGIKIVEFDKSQNDQVERLYFACLSKNLTSIAIQFSTIGEQIFIEPFNEKTPKLFLGFPLIGTEDFHFPVIVNNPFLEPTEPRDGVFLTEMEEENILNNKRIIQESVELYFIFLQYATINNWQNLYLLAKTDLPKDKDWISTDWYKNQIQKVLRDELMQTEIVYTDNLQQPKIKLKDALFPYSKSEEKISTIWEFANTLWSNRLPKKEHIGFWYAIIDSNWGKNLRYNLKQFITDIAGFSNISELANHTNKSEQELLNWLNKIISFVLSEEQGLLNEFAIIPNQYGKFLKQEELWTDDNIPEELKNVLNILQEDWRTNLKHNQIINCKLTTTKGIEDIVLRINQIIEKDSNANIKAAVLELISCFSSDNSQEGDDFWQFAKDFYQTTPDKKKLVAWTPAIRKESNKWFINSLCKDIEQNQNLANLTNHLKQDVLEWLHSFVVFIGKHKFENCFNDYAILPNQRSEFAKKQNLFVDNSVDDTLKDILEELGSDCRSVLLVTEIELDIEGKIYTSKKVASDISEIVERILKNEGIEPRQEKNKRVFAKLLLWFHENEKLAKDIFGTLYEKRYRLRSDEEIIEDIKFRQAISNNKNGYTEEEVLELINTPKEEWQEFQKSKESREKDIEIEIEELTALENPQDILTMLGIYSLEGLEQAKYSLVGTKFSEILHRIPTNSLEAFERVHSMIQRAKENIKFYLSSKDDYNCENWYEENFTVIAGITKKDRPIKIVVRPSDGRQVIIFYPSEFDALESPDTELWIDNNITQEILTLGKVLKKMRIYRILL